MPRMQISTGQFMWMTIGFTMGSASLIFIGGEAGKDAWITIITGALEGMLICLPFLLLTKRFPGMGISRINDLVWGKYLGKFFTLAFIWYTLTLCSIVITDSHGFNKTLLLNGMPDYPVILASFLILAAFCIYEIEVMARFSMVIMPIIFIFIVFVTILSIPYIDLNNLRPILETPLPKLLAVTHGLATFPFGENVAFMAIIPFLAKPKKALSYSYLGIGITTLFFLLLTLRNFAVLSDATTFFTYPAYTTARIINVAGVFTRMEVLVAINFIMLCILKEAVLLYAATITTAELLNLKNFKTVVIPLAFLAALFSSHNFSSTVHNIVYSSKIYPIYALPFEFIFPFITLLAAVFMKKQGQEIKQPWMEV